MFSMDDKTVPQGDLIKESTEATFMQDVIEASREVPVIVDFWATWCGPCRTLGPALEAAVLAAKGKVKMVKVDVDKNQMIAAQLRIQSIPTVYAFWRSNPDIPNSDLQLSFVPASYVMGRQAKLDDFPGMSIATWQQRPESSGHVRLRSSDPFDKPIIQPNG